VDDFAGCSGAVGHCDYSTSYSAAGCNCFVGVDSAIDCCGVAAEAWTGSVGQRAVGEGKHSGHRDNSYQQHNKDKLLGAHQVRYYFFSLASYQVAKIKY
jgi:hypothetical protein